MKYILELAAAHYGVISAFALGALSRNKITSLYAAAKAKLSTVKL